MRTVYVDVLIAVNILIDFFLLLATSRILHIRAKPIRLILGGAFGGLVSLVALLPELPPAVNFPVDVICAAAIVFICFGRASPRIYLKRVTIYFTVSFCFCGIMMFICTVFRPNGTVVLNDVVYFNISPILLIILTLISYYLLKLIRRFSSGEIGAKICNVELDAGNKKYFFPAKIDTSCNVKEPFSGDLVIIADDVLLENYSPPEKYLRIIPFQSLGGNGILKGFKPDSVKIDGTEIEAGVYLGYGKKILDGEIKAIVPYELVSQVIGA